MSLPRKHTRDEDERPVPDVLTPRPVESEKVGLRKSGTAEAAKISKLSAQMVELSLQQTQRDPILDDPFPAQVSAAKPSAVSSSLPDPLPAKPNPVSSPLPLPWPTTSAAPPQPPQPQETSRESKIANYWKNVRRNLDNWLAGARVRGSAAVRTLREHARAAQKQFAVSNFRTVSNFGTVSTFGTKTNSRDGAVSGRWTSTGVAALSAVLVVGVVLGVRHYAFTPDTPQPRGQNASPVIPAMQDISQPRRRAIVARNGAAAVQHPARSSAAKHAAAKAQTRKIRRRNQDDDYVAKDTYVYYGSKGKPAR